MAAMIGAATSFASANAAGISLAGTAISFLGAGDEADAEERAGLFNAEAARLRSEASRFQTKEDIIDLKRASFKQIGNARASIGASGVRVSGSVLDVLAESAYRANIDVQRREIRGNFEKAGLNVQEQLFRSSAKSASDGKLFKQASAVLTGASALTRFG